MTFERTDMLLQPCLRAHSSAAASSCAPAPRLRCPSATTSPFTSARISTSSRGCLLTCTQPITPSLADSATNTACCDAGAIPRIRSRICAAVAGYPSWPESTAIRGASALFARRIFSSLSCSLSWTLAAIISGRFPSQPRLDGCTFQFAKRVRGNPARRTRTLTADSFRRANGFAIEPYVPFPDLPKRPVDRLLHEISLIMRFSLDDRKQSLILCVRRGFIAISEVGHQRETCALLEFLFPAAPLNCLCPYGRRKN